MAIKRVTLQDIADELRCDPSTVSLALRNSPKIPEETRVRVKTTARSMGYRPNLHARVLLGKNTNTIGVLVPWLNDQYFVEVFQRQEEWLREVGYFSILGVTHRDSVTERNAVDSLLDRGVDGLLFDYVPRNRDVLNVITGLVNSGMPVAMVGGKVVEGTDVVDFALAERSEEMTKYLLSLGHRRILLVRGAADPDLREVGYRRAFEESGLPVDPQLIVRYSQETHDVEMVCEAVSSLSKPATAVFAYNDDIAAKVALSLLKKGLRIPEDVSIAGINDSWIATMFRVPLTTVHQPDKEMAEAAARMLIERVERRADECAYVLFDGRLVVRESTASPRLTQRLATEQTVEITKNT